MLEITKKIKGKLTNAEHPSLQLSKQKL